MSFGAQGEQVTILQRELASDPSIYPEGLVTGYYGSATKAAVGRFQEKYQLGTPSTPGYGGVGPLTLVKFNEVYGSTPQ
jgi:peptidoglycan hydrolase-like protein with peptidoglycan-binding domain